MSSTAAARAGVGGAGLLGVIVVVVISLLSGGGGEGGGGLGDIIGQMTQGASAGHDGHLQRQRRHGRVRQRDLG
jgi:hypothetical protein